VSFRKSVALVCLFVSKEPELNAAVRIIYRIKPPGIMLTGGYAKGYGILQIKILVPDVTGY
jgi:hypothetical protein